jgi:hypothetical protein
MRPPAFLVAFLLLCVAAEVFAALREAEVQQPTVAVAPCEDACGCPPRPVVESCCCEEPGDERLDEAPRAMTARSSVRALRAQGRAARRVPARTRVAPFECGSSRPRAALAPACPGPATIAAHPPVQWPEPEPAAWNTPSSGGLRHGPRPEPDTPPPRGS